MAKSLENSLGSLVIELLNKGRLQVIMWRNKAFKALPLYDIIIYIKPGFKKTNIFIASWINLICVK